MSAHLAPAIIVNDWSYSRLSLCLYFIKTCEERHGTESPVPRDVTVHLSVASARKANNSKELLPKNPVIRKMLLDRALPSYRRLVLTDIACYVSGRAFRNSGSLVGFSVWKSGFDLRRVNLVQ